MERDLKTLDSFLFMSSQCPFQDVVLILVVQDNDICILECRLEEGMTEKANSTDLQHLRERAWKQLQTPALMTYTSELSPMNIVAAMESGKCRRHNKFPHVYLILLPLGKCVL